MHRLLALIVFTLSIACASTPSDSASTGATSSAGDDAAKREQTKATLGELTRAVSAFDVQNNRCPTSVEELMRDGLIASVPNDPWGNPVAFMPPSDDNPGNAFVSGGPDGQLLTADDITVNVSCTTR